MEFRRLVLLTKVAGGAVLAICRNLHLNQRNQRLRLLPGRDLKTDAAENPSSLQAPTFHPPLSQPS